MKKSSDSETSSQEQLKQTSGKKTTHERTRGKERVKGPRQQLAEDLFRVRQELTLSQKLNVSQDNTIQILQNRLNKLESQRNLQQEKQVSKT